MIKNFSQQNAFLSYINSTKCDAYCIISGNKNFPLIKGKTEFYQINGGVLVVTEIRNLPENQTGNFFAMHIHDIDNCNQDSQGNYEDSHHLNLTGASHPNHTGDLPVILSNNGYAFSVNLTNRFCVEDIINKTIIIHDNADDFRTNPSGNSGTKIACGVIKKN